MWCVSFESLKIFSLYEIQSPIFLVSFEQKKKKIMSKNAFDLLCLRFFWVDICIVVISKYHSDTHFGFVYCSRHKETRRRRLNTALEEEVWEYWEWPPLLKMPWELGVGIVPGWLGSIVHRIIEWVTTYVICGHSIESAYLCTALYLVEHCV